MKTFLIGCWCFAEMLSMASAQVTECVGGTKQGPFGLFGTLGCAVKSDGFHKVTFGTTSCQQYIECAGGSVVLYHCCLAGETFDNGLQSCRPIVDETVDCAAAVSGTSTTTTTTTTTTAAPVTPASGAALVARGGGLPLGGNFWTTQISTSGSAGGSELARDGDASTCAVTGHHSSPYWAARLDAAATVTSVTLVGRDVFSNITITVSDTFDVNTGERSGEQLCTRWPTDRDLAAGAHFPCSRPVTGRYLVVSGSPPLDSRSRYFSMALCEVYIN